jgi:ATP-dependent DNA helicase RecG
VKTENGSFEQKSIRYALGRHEDLNALACDCVGLANAVGGTIALGIEAGRDAPPAGQTVPSGMPEHLRKRLAQVTVNVATDIRLEHADNDAEWVHIRVLPSRQSIAATSDGRYFIRLADETHRLMPDELGRLLSERQSFVWELQTPRRIPADRTDADQRASFLDRIRASDRVSDFVREKTDAEVLEHYLFVKEGVLTNLGILWMGRREDRAALLYPPVIQCIKYDERDQKVRKWMWADYDLNPQELIEAVWRDVPEWRESYELPDGLFRKNVPHYEEVVVRELLGNALVHRPYTQSGDIFINLYPDRMEVHNPGPLPLGVTPRNILHASMPRNAHLARVFYDLRMMEREGSGYDRMYEVLVSAGKPIPEVVEGADRVVVTVRKRIADNRIVDFMVKADQTLQLTQRERITLGLLAQTGTATAIDLCRLLDLPAAPALTSWLGRLPHWGVVKTRGQTKGLAYFVAPDLLRRLEFKGATTLKGIEPHRLRELVIEDLGIYRNATIREIQARIGAEIPIHRIRRALDDLIGGGAVATEGRKRWTRYIMTESAE